MNFLIGLLALLAGIFGWAVCLAITARFVFGAQLGTVCGWFFLGVAMNFTGLLIVARKFPDLPLSFFTPEERTINATYELFVFGPLLLTATTAAYLWIRKFELAAPSDGTTPESDCGDRQG